MTSKARELDGKVCVVTGGSRGIGAAIGELFVAHGGRVAVLDRETEAGQETTEKLSRSGEARFYRIDVGDEGSVIDCVRQVSKDFGAVHVLCNNAGIGRLGTSFDFSLADWDLSFRVNTTGTFLCSREFGRVMRDGGGGAIVNISSINGLVNFPMRLAYSASKAAVVSMTKVLAVEWAGYKIRVNAVAPGMTETTMLREAIDQGLIEVDTYMKQTPLHRFGKPSEIAEAVLYFSSERSSYVTGQVIAPDGGWTAFNWIPWSGDPDAPDIA
jgi:3-oxoacyl-[acyl-carrier protein] reductase